MIGLGRNSVAETRPGRKSQGGIRREHWCNHTLTLTTCRSILVYFEVRREAGYLSYGVDSGQREIEVLQILGVVVDAQFWWLVRICGIEDAELVPVQMPVSRGREVARDWRIPPDLLRRTGWRVKQG